MQVPITKRTAGVLHNMWNNNAAGDDVPHEGLLEKVNSQFERYGWQTFTPEELILNLETLERLGCIERTANSIRKENIQWRLKEKVKLAS